MAPPTYPPSHDLSPSERHCLICPRCDDSSEFSGPHFEVWWAPSERGHNQYADWTIVVESESSSLKRSFSVHQPMLSCKSKYFEAVFQSRFSECGAKTSTFRFPEMVVKGFQLFLDCIYKFEFSHTDDGYFLSTEERVVLLYLLDYFQVEDQFQKCDHQHQIFLGNFLAYHNCLNEIHFPYLRDLITRTGAQFLSAEHYCDCENGLHKILAAIEVSYFVEMFKHESRNRKCEASGETLVYFLEHRKSEVDASLFGQLTGAEVLPNFSPKAALGLLALLESYQEHESDSKNACRILEGRSHHTLDVFESFTLSKAMNPRHLALLFELATKGSSTERNIWDECDPEVLEASIRDAMEKEKIATGQFRKLTVTLSEYDMNGLYWRQEGAEVWEIKYYGLQIKRTEDGEWQIEKYGKIAYTNSNLMIERPPPRGWTSTSNGEESNLTVWI